MRKIAFCLLLAAQWACQTDPNKPAYWVDKLDSKRPSERMEAANRLRRFKDVADASKISALLKDEDPRVRSAAAEALGDLGDKATVPQLIDSLDLSVGGGSDRETRSINEANRSIVNALGQLGDRQAVPSLIKLLHSKDSYVKLAAVEALGRLRDPAAVDPLMAIATDDNQEAFIAKKAITALGQIGDARAVPAIERMLFREREGKSFYAEASFAVFQIGEPAATPLINLLDGRDKAMEQWAADNKILPEALFAKTAQVLGDIGDPRADKALVSRLHYDEGDYKLLVRSSAAESLGRLRDKEAAPVIASLLGEEEANIRDAYGRALVMIGDRSVLPQIVKAAQSGSWDAREGSLHALSNLGTAKELPEVEKIAAAEPARWLKECTESGNDADSCQKVWPDHKKILDNDLARLKAAQECGDQESCWIGKLKSPSGAVRERAAYELGHMGKADAIPPLLAAVQDDDLPARFAEIMALNWLIQGSPEGKAQSKIAAERLNAILSAEEGKLYYIKIDEDLKRLAVRLDQATKAA